MNTILSFVFISVVLLVVSIGLIENFSKLSVRRIILYLAAVIIGLIIGALLSAPLSKLPGIYGEIMPIVVSFISVVFALLLSNNLQPQLDRWFDSLKGMLRLPALHLPSHHEDSPKIESVIDTSVLIDKRIVSIASSGFLPQKIVVPRFVLAELQGIADSKDGDRRDRGRRGLIAVEELKKIKRGDLAVVGDDFPDIAEVDHKLVRLSKKRNASLLTTDYNLNKVAGAEGVKVLNINDLAAGLRPDHLPGEELVIKVIHIGKDKTQGVGYLEDGTMIVLENGSKYLGKEVRVKISRALQTSAGKMFFSRITNA
jgi:uncharacterized protein YacL